MTFGHLQASNPSNNAPVSQDRTLDGVITAADIKQLRNLPLSGIRFKDTQNRNFTEAEKRQILDKLIEVNELALKYREYKNVSGIYNSSIVEMSNGVVGKGTGAEGHVEMPVCSEQGAIADAMRLTTSKLMLSPNAIPDSALKAVPKALRVFHAGDRLQPCANCMDWMHSGIFFSPETEIVSLHKVGNGHKGFEIDLKQGKDILPLSLSEAASFSSKPLAYLPVQLSENAKRVMNGGKKFNQNDLRRLLSRAKQDYFRALYQFNLKPRTRLGVSSAVLLESGHVAQSPHIELRRSTHAMPDLTAFSIALTKTLDMHSSEKSSPKVFAVAYFGVDPDFPRPSNLNAFAHPNWGSPEVLVVSVHNDVIKVRTISDYLPYDFHKHKLKLSTRTTI